jgi:hypothetical protein
VGKRHVGHGDAVAPSANELTDARHLQLQLVEGEAFKVQIDRLLAQEVGGKTRIERDGLQDDAFTSQKELVELAVVHDLEHI